MCKTVEIPAVDAAFVDVYKVAESELGLLGLLTLVRSAGLYGLVVFLELLELFR